MRTFAAAVLVAIAAFSLFAQRPDVVTAHADSQRTGVYHDRFLTRENVRTLIPGFTHALNGRVEAQPLYVPGVHIGPDIRDLVIVQTTANTVYAFDANSDLDDKDDCDKTKSAARIWCRQLNDLEKDSKRIWPLPIALATPVIDRTSNTAYVVYATGNRGALPKGCVCNVCIATLPPCEEGYDVEFFLAAIDLTTGTDRDPKRPAVKITAKNENASDADFHAYDHMARPALLLDNGSVYVAFGMRPNEETHDYHGWVIWFDARTLELQGSFCTTPKVRNVFGVPKGQGQGAGIWQSGGGLAADKTGAVYFETSNGNGRKDAYGDSVVRLTRRQDGTGRDAAVFDAVAHDPKHQHFWLASDIDLGSGSPVVIPNTQLVVAGGKTGIFYVLDGSATIKPHPGEPRSGLPLRQEVKASYRQFGSGGDDLCRYDAWQGGPHLHASATYWQPPGETRGYLFHWAENDHLKRFEINPADGRIDPKSAHYPAITDPPEHVNNPCGTSESLMPGGMTALSANGREGIVWVTLPQRHRAHVATHGLLMAFDALRPDTPSLWQAPIPFAKFAPPVIGDGQVFVVGLESGTVQSFKLPSGLIASWQRKHFCATPCGYVLRDPASGALLPLKQLGETSWCENCRITIGAKAFIRTLRIDASGTPAIVFSGSARPETYDRAGNNPVPSNFAFQAKPSRRDFAGCKGCQAIFGAGGEVRGVLMEGDRVRAVIGTIAVRPSPPFFADDRAQRRVAGAMAVAGDAAAKILPPPTACLLFTAEFRGEQAYVANLDNASLVWKPEVLSGILTDDSSHHTEGGMMEVGTIAGAEWRWHDGSHTRARVTASIPAKDAPTWQRLETANASGTGTLARVRFMQRFDTAEAPLAPPKHAGEKTHSDLVAAYAFYGEDGEKDTKTPIRRCKR